LFGDRHGEALLLVVLAAGGLGLGIQFSALIAHLSNAVPPRYAPDISGVSSTLMQIGGTVGVAAFGTLYLGLAADGATHAFAVVTAAFAAAALLAAAAAYRSTASGRAKW
jgi:MFS family permease